MKIEDNFGTLYQNFTHQTKESILSERKQIFDLLDSLEIELVQNKNKILDR
jgi:hypothetical protein